MTSFGYRIRVIGLDNLLLGDFLLAAKVTSFGCVILVAGQDDLLLGGCLLAL